MKHVVSVLKIVDKSVACLLMVELGNLVLQSCTKMMGIMSCIKMMGIMSTQPITLRLNTNFSDINRDFQEYFGCGFTYRDIMILV